MNRFGCFLAGILFGVLVMQVGLALYLRSVDFAFAAVVSFLLGPVVVGLGNLWADEWI